MISGQAISSNSGLPTRSSSSKIKNKTTATTHTSGRRKASQKRKAKETGDSGTTTADTAAKNNDDNHPQEHRLSLSLSQQQAQQIPAVFASVLQTPESPSLASVAAALANEVHDLEERVKAEREAAARTVSRSNSAEPSSSLLPLPLLQDLADYARQHLVHKETEETENEQNGHKEPDNEEDQTTARSKQHHSFLFSASTSTSLSLSLVSQTSSSLSSREALQSLVQELRSVAACSARNSFEMILCREQLRRFVAQFPPARCFCHRCGSGPWEPPETTCGACTTTLRYPEADASDMRLAEDFERQRLRRRSAVLGMKLRALQHFNRVFPVSSSLALSSSSRSNGENSEGKRDNDDDRRPNTSTSNSLQRVGRSTRRHSYDHNHYNINNPVTKKTSAESSVPRAPRRPSALAPSSVVAISALKPTSMHFGGGHGHGHSSHSSHAFENTSATTSSGGIAVQHRGAAALRQAAREADSGSAGSGNGQQSLTTSTSTPGSQSLSNRHVPLPAMPARLRTPLRGASSGRAAFHQQQSTVAKK